MYYLLNLTLPKLLHQQYHKAPRGSTEKAEAGKKLRDIISHTRHVDRSINQITKILFGDKKASQILKLIRPSSQPLVDDWSCLKMLVSDPSPFPMYLF